MVLFLFMNVAYPSPHRRFRSIRPLKIGSLALAVLCLALSRPSCWAQTNNAGPDKSEKAKALYQKLCQRCHAADGKGDPGTEGVPDFTRRSWHEQKRDAQLIVSILDGKGAVMPSFNGKLNQEQAKELVAYIRAFASNP